MSRMFYTDAERAEQDRALLYSRIKELENAIDLALFHLRRNDHVDLPTGGTCTRQMICALAEAKGTEA